MKCIQTTIRVINEFYILISKGVKIDFCVFMSNVATYYNIRILSNVIFYTNNLTYKLHDVK